MIDYKALHAQCRREGKDTLDLDDVAAGHPVAEAELAELQALYIAVDKAMTSMQMTPESFDTPEQAIAELLAQERSVAEYFQEQKRRVVGEILATCKVTIADCCCGETDDAWRLCPVHGGESCSR